MKHKVSMLYFKVSLLCGNIVWTSQDCLPKFRIAFKGTLTNFYATKFKGNAYNCKSLFNATQFCFSLFKVWVIKAPTWQVQNNFTSVTKLCSFLVLCETVKKKRSKIKWKHRGKKQSNHVWHHLDNHNLITSWFWEPFSCCWPIRTDCWFNDFL